ncbi:MAG: F420-dependent methylenetetrahydromethanopterin dehydrogenase [Candidatus Bathyarchaeia archaeon]
MSVKVGFVKLGNIGSAPLVEFLLDERAEREDLTVRVVGSGAKMGVGDAEEASKIVLSLDPGLVVLTTPNASLPGPMRAVELVSRAGKPCIVISDAPAKKALKGLEELGAGYIVVEADSMIGARREFLDPEEMALFNADLIRILAVTGVFKAIRDELDKAIQDLKEGKTPRLPRLILDSDVVDSAGFANPYAKSKAMAAYGIASSVASLTVKGCFMVKEWEKYVPMVSAAHEMMRTASRLADEAREMEKYGDSVLRTPHYDDGSILYKRRLMEKPKPREGQG